MNSSQMLLRSLLYTDKTKDDEFGLSKQVLDELYGLYITSKDTISWTKCPTFIEFFNEVFYQLTLLYDDVSAPEHITDFINGEMWIFPPEPRYAHNDHTSDANQARSEYQSEKRSIQKYVYCFVWLILKKMPRFPRHVSFALLALNKYLTSSGSLMFETFKKFSDSHKIVIELDIVPTPDTSMLWLSGYEEWCNVTKDYDCETIRHIVNRFNTVQEKNVVITELKKHCAKRLDEEGNYPKFSRVTLKGSADESFLDKLFKEAGEEEVQREEEAKAIEQSKDERIAELEAQVKELKREKDEAIRDKKEAERERDKYRKRLEELNSRLNRKYIPASLKCEEAQLILNELMRKDIISPLGHNTYEEFKVQFYRWDETGALFGYFVDKMNFQLELYDSGGHINWKEFKPAFSNYEEKIKRARDTVSYYTQHPEARKPEKSEIIDEAIAKAEETLKQKKDQPQSPKIGLGMPKLPSGT